MGWDLKVGRIGHLLLVVQNEEQPTDAEWNEFLSALQQARPDFDHLKILVVTDGGGPNASQRKRLAETLEGRVLRVAVISDSVKVRFVASMIALFQKEHRSFLKSEFRRACTYLGLTVREVDMARDAIDQMTTRLRSSERRLER